jgi:hypothetical protein
MEEEKYLGRICVAFREGKEVEIIVSDVEVLSRLQHMLPNIRIFPYIDALV